MELWAHFSSSFCCRHDDGWGSRCGSEGGSRSRGREAVASTGAASIDLIHQGWLHFAPTGFNSIRFDSVYCIIFVLIFWLLLLSLCVFELLFRLCDSRAPVWATCFYYYFLIFFSVDFDLVFTRAVLALGCNIWDIYYEGHLWIVRLPVVWNLNNFMELIFRRCSSCWLFEDESLYICLGNWVSYTLSTGCNAIKFYSHRFFILFMGMSWGLLPPRTHHKVVLFCPSMEWKVRERKNNGQDGLSLLMKDFLNFCLSLCFSWMK